MTNIEASSESIETEVVGDVLALRDEIAVRSTSYQSTKGHRNDFVDTLNNELGIDCEAVQLSSTSADYVVYSEPATINPENVVDIEIVNTRTNIEDIHQTADEVEQVTESYNEKVYTLPVETVKDFRSGVTINVDQVPIYLGSIQNILSSDIQYPDWDTRKRFKDILILEDVLVDQLGISKSIAAAIIGNVCYEDSFASITKSEANLSSFNEASNRLGVEDRGFGIAQWTSKFRQNKLKEYYNIACQDLDWETAAVVAECVYLYNELRASNLLGDLTKEYDLEQATGKLGWEYLAYADRNVQWERDDNGHYTSIDCPRYNYALKVYHYMLGE